MNWVSIGKQTNPGATPWQRAKWHAVYNQNRIICELCGVNKATDAHHAVVKRDIRFKEVDNIANVMMLCHECHMHHEPDIETGLAFSVTHNGYDRVKRWLMACDSAGKEVDEQLRLLEYLKE